MLENINMRIIQKYLGHAKIDTAEFYTHIDLSGLRDAGNVIDVTMQNYIIDYNKEIH
jgi:site-specific recombinase XerD